MRSQNMPRRCCHCFSGQRLIRQRLFALKAQIETLKTVPGTDEVVEAKQLEINRLRETDH